MPDSFSKVKESLPVLGVGLGLRREIFSETFEHRKEIDWLEITPENYMNAGGKVRKILDQAAGIYPLVSHGVNLSLGSVDPLNSSYLRALKELLDEYDLPWFSDHICFASADGVYIHDLLPMPLTREAVKHLVDRIVRVRDYVGRPILIENISYYLKMPDAEMEETEFISSVLEEADCGLLLDINNVYVNSVNHGFDPVKFLDGLPLERTVQIHMAGHLKYEGRLIDTHGEAVPEPVFELLSHVLKRADVNAVMIERDQNFPDFAELVAQLNLIRTIQEQAKAATVARGSATASARPVEISAVKSDEMDRRGKLLSRGRHRAAAKAASLKDIERTFIFGAINLELDALLENPSDQSVRFPSPLRKVLKRFEKNSFDCYSRMFMAAHEGNMESLYPSCAQLLGKRWRYLMRHHLQQCPAREFTIRSSGEGLGPYFSRYWPEIVKEFPFICELADFDWIKVSATTSAAIPEVGIRDRVREMSQMTGLRPILNSAMTVCHFNYNLADISSRIRQGNFDEKIAVEPESVCFAVLRRPDNDDVEVVTLDKRLELLVTLAGDGRSTYRQLLDKYMEGMPSKDDPLKQVLGFLELVETLQQCWIFTGSAR